MMAIPRNQLVDPEAPLFYHIVSRCVRRAWLCGFDRLTRKDYTHRKEWLVERLKVLGKAFAVDIYAYAVMSNHFHLVIHYNPKAPLGWTDLEVVDRWLSVCPPKLADGSIDSHLVEFKRRALLADTESVDELRTKLGSLSLFMKLLKQPIARRSNLEDRVTGHFFEQRFYSSPLLCEASVKSAMAYVDLNPIRAKIARSIAESEHTSIFERIQSLDPSHDLAEYLAPLVSGLNEATKPTLTLGDYIEHLEALYSTRQKSFWSEFKINRWRAQIEQIARYQRVYGPESAIKEWVSRRGWQLREDAMLP